MTVIGQKWQSVLGHRVEIGDPAASPPGSVATWNHARWGQNTWGTGWAPTFRDVTPDVLHVHSSVGALGLDVAGGVGTLEVELLDLEGVYSPSGSTDWLLGRHVRAYVTPTGAAETPFFYGVIDKAAASGTFALPVLEITAYDVRSLIGSAASQTPVANQPETASVRLANIAAAAALPSSATHIETDTTTLLADETTELGDLFDRTIASAAGLAWADAYGRVVTRNRDWIHATGTSVALYVYAGTPPVPPPPGVVVAQTSGALDATESFATVRNFVTYANRNDPVESVTVLDRDSIGRYGYRRSETSDLACGVALLQALAGRALSLYKQPIPVCEGATVTVYDADTARAAALQLGQLVVLGRNDPGVTVWERTGIVAGLEITLDADGADVGITVVAVGTIGVAESRWDSGRWGNARWVT